MVTSNILSKGLHGFDSLDDAIEKVKEIGVTTEDGTVLKYLNLGDKFNVSAPMVLSVVPINEDEEMQSSLFVEGVELLKRSTGETGWRPDILAAPYPAFSSDIGTALISASEVLGARCFLSMRSETVSGAITNRLLFGSDRITPVYQDGIFDDVIYDGGAVAAWLRVSIDASRTDGYGWALSISNKVLPFTEVTPTVGFVNGRADETDPLIENQIMSFINHYGTRSWEYSTCSIDAIWQDARRVRIYDVVSDAILNAIFFAVDGEIKDLKSAKKTLRNFMKGLESSQIMIGQEVMVDVERVVESAITNGEFYFYINSQESMSPRKIHVTFNRTDIYSSKTITLLEEV